MPAPNLTQDEPVPAGRALYRHLVYVLDYEDLLREQTCVFPLGPQRPGPLRLGRAAGGGPPQRSDAGELLVADGWMSSAHAILEVVEPSSHPGGGYLLRDLGSRNGTFVNGRRAHEQLLRDGDLIEVGHSLLCYRECESPPHAAQVRLGPTRTVCPELVTTLQQLQRVAPSPEPILVLAETGAGKEVMAHHVHALSGRGAPLCAVDCGAVPESLFESAFFGHVKGAFTGAAAAQFGHIQRAHGGTLFLDEVANLSIGSQAKLLRALEEGRVTPIGADRPVAVDVRYVAATNVDLLRLPPRAADDRFRPDLLRRLMGFVARIPPLRQRREDLGFLVAHLLRDAGAPARVAIRPSAARALFPSPFPGNIRDLRAALRSALLLMDAGVIEPEHLPEHLPNPPPAAPTAVPAVPAVPEGAPRSESIGAAELEAALGATSGNVVHAAQRLGVHPRQLYRLIERHGLVLARFRKGRG